MFLLTLIAIIVIFSVLVLVHEYGHFIMARRAGIRVLEFGIGFPPRIFKKEVRGTTYSINAVPFGGFVKLYGEDASDPGVLRSRESFASQSAWVRIQVVIAGVIMNIALAIVLLTLGFAIGIQPLIVNQGDLFEHIDSGVVKISSGAFVKNVDPEVTGIPPLSHIYTINGAPVSEPQQLQIFAKGKAERDLDLEISSLAVFGPDIPTIHVPVLKNKSYGIELKPSTLFPRLAIFSVQPGSRSALAGIAAGDIIIAINGKEIYRPVDFDRLYFGADESLAVLVLRNNLEQEITVPASQSRRVVVADVFRGSVAAENGIERQDIFISIDGTPIFSSEQVKKIVGEKAGKAVTYEFMRGGDLVQIVAKTKTDERLGVALDHVDFFADHDLSLYQTSVLTSVVSIGTVSYPIYSALLVSISESVRLTGLTIGAFVNTVASIFQKFEVPDDIGGPVQIAYYTHTFLKEGFLSLIRFTALLSLSLAVINVLPIPALDGGRLLFILIEVVFRRRLHARSEAFIHSLGFILLLLLILIVTYSDIVKLLT